MASILQKPSTGGQFKSPNLSTPRGVLQQARRFAEAIGQCAKTDAVDAAMLARFGALDALQTRPVVSQTLSDMKELLVARRALVKDRVAAANRNHVHRAPLLKRLADQRLRQVERQIAAMDAALRAPCRADAELKARLDILVSIPATGEATALAMLIEMPELGTMDNKCVASLAGLAPVARDSGQHSGKRFIRAGHAHLRQALYPILFSAWRIAGHSDHWARLIGAPGAQYLVRIL